MRAPAVELAGRGIRVNCVYPGGVDTLMVERAAHGVPADVDWTLIAKSAWSSTAVSSGDPPRG